MGQDISSVFRGGGTSDHKHSSSASKQMRGMLVGWITEEARVSQDSVDAVEAPTHEFRPDLSKPVVLQVCWTARWGCPQQLHTAYSKQRSPVLKRRRRFAGWPPRPSIRRMGIHPGPFASLRTILRAPDPRVHQLDTVVRFAPASVITLAGRNYQVVIDRRQARVVRWLIPLVWMPIAIAAIQHACMHQHTPISVAAQYTSLGLLLWCV
jgi:hypothetical protein